MRSTVCLFWVAAAIFIVAGYGFTEEAWEYVAGIKDADLKEVVVDGAKEGLVYVSGLKRLYRSEDNGKTWDQVFSARGNTNSINFVSIFEQGVFVCTEQGVYRSVDGKTAYKRIFKGIGEGENSALHIGISQDGRIYLGTRGGLFTSNDDAKTWGRDSKEAGSLSVRWISLDGDDIFIAAETGVYKKTANGWKRVFVTAVEESEYDADSTDEAVSTAGKPVNSIMVRQEKIFLAADNGIFVSEDKGDSWNRWTSDGLISLKVKRILFDGDFLAATDKGVFVFDEKENNWEALYKGMDADEAKSLAVDNKGAIWVATNKGLYKHKERLLRSATRLSAKPRAFGGETRNDSEEENVLELFSNEPSIREMQEAAIRYAEVHPDKINKWREAANKKALLPNVSVGLDRYVTDYWHWDAGANPDVLLKGDDTVAWDITMTWDMGELIWNDDQTSIDTRSRLMVQLRDDVLDEVNRTYFERRRLQLELHLSPSSDIKSKLEKELRFQELTADLDGLTGGYFSKQIE